jgi:type IV pilus assembly protein PilC
MATFSCVAIDAKGNAVNTKVDGANRADVINSLTKQGLRPVSIKEFKNTTVKLDLGKIGRRKKVKTDQLVMFTRQLSAMISAGVPILRALSALAEHISESPVLQDILRNVIHDIESGSTLGDALAKHPETFNDIYVNMVRAGEAAGILDDVLKRLAIQQEKNSAMRKRIKSAMAYPVVLICITVLAFFGLMIFIIPKIGGIMTDLGGPDAKLPGLTVAMLAISDFIVAYWYIIVILIGGGVFGFITIIKTKKGKRWWHNVLLKMPLVKTIIKKNAIARFARTFSALIEAGVAVLEALDVTSRAVGNVIYEEALVDAESKVKNGKSLSSVISANPLFPAIVSQMLIVGEETGQTGQIIVKVADFYEEEVDASISGLGTIIEPIMIVIMGGMVGLIAASVMLPIAGLAQNIS